MADPNLEKMCQLIHDHPVPTDDRVDFSHYVFDLLYQPANRLKLERGSCYSISDSEMDLEFVSM